MAITLRGSATDFDVEVNGNLVCTLPGGTAQNDVVYAGFASGRITDVDMQMVTTGYTELADLYQDDTTDTNLAVFRKIQGGTPDSTAEFLSTGTGTGIGMTAFVYVLTGVDTGTPEDATTQTAQAPNATDPDPPSITTVTNNAWVLAIGATSEADAITTAPTGYSDLVDIQQAGVASPISIMVSRKEVTPAGAENPGAYTEPAGTTADCWCAASVAVRPAAASTPSFVFNPSIPAFLAAALMR